MEYIFLYVLYILFHYFILNKYCYHIKSVIICILTIFPFILVNLYNVHNNILFIHYFYLTPVLPFPPLNFNLKVQIQIR